MWKAVIADDERVIVRGLRKLIDWEELGIEIVEEAGDGQQLKRAIEYIEPDIVLADIMMPYMNGLEVIQWYNQKYSRAKFIFASGYQEFSYAKEALKNGAVDYLLKPVGRRDLEEALRKAVRQLEEQTAIEIFREEKNEIQNLFRKINDGRDFEYNDLYELFQSENWNLENSFFVGICAGIRPDVANRMNKEDFGQYNLLRFSVFNQLNGAFSDRKLGFVVQKEDSSIHIIGVFPQKDRDCYLEKYVIPIQREVEEKSGIKLCFGVGTPTEEITRIIDSYKSAKTAFSLYFFERQDLIRSERPDRAAEFPLDQYIKDVEQVFRSIVSHDEHVLDVVDQVLQDVENMHYGNPKAAVLRVTNFVGDLNFRLEQYHLLNGNVYEIQERLEKLAADSVTFEDMKRDILSFYKDLVEKIRETDMSRDKDVIEKVKQYIRENYAADLSIKELADVACVSRNYFSAMFKKEAGQNYKSYLTGIRMEKAIELLRETDYKTYEIGEKVGYNNVRRFVDAFKQIYSISPMEYKKTIKNEKK